MKKRTVALLLSLIMSISMTACGESNNSEETQQVETKAETEEKAAESKEAVESETVEETKSAETEETKEGELYIGDWTITGYSTSGDKYMAPDEYAKKAGKSSDELTATYTFEDDGTVTLSSKGSVNKKGTWKAGTTEDGRPTAIVTMDGKETVFVYDEEKDTFVIEGGDDSISILIERYGS